MLKIEIQKGFKTNIYSVFHLRFCWILQCTLVRNLFSSTVNENCVKVNKTYKNVKLVAQLFNSKFPVKFNPLDNIVSYLYKEKKCRTKTLQVNVPGRIWSKAFWSQTSDPVQMSFSVFKLIQIECWVRTRSKVLRDEYDGIHPSHCTQKETACFSNLPL